MRFKLERDMKSNDTVYPNVFEINKTRLDFCIVSHYIPAQVLLMKNKDFLIHKKQVYTQTCYFRTSIYLNIQRIYFSQNVAHNSTVDSQTLCQTL